MNRKKKVLSSLLIIFFISMIVGMFTATTVAQDNSLDDELSAAKAAKKENSGSILGYVKAGGPIGYFIILMSFAGVALVVNAFMSIKEDALIPAGVVEQVDRLTRSGRFAEVLSLCKSHDSMFSRIVSDGMSQGELGLSAVRETIQESGNKEITRLQQRVGYIGFIAAIAPMLGLLGTVTGMISSFGILGSEVGAARPDQLAVGISEALVTTCMGLIVAVPLMFFHNFFRDRITRIAQESSGLCEKLMRTMGAIIETRSAATTPAGNPQTAQKTPPAATPPSQSPPPQEPPPSDYRSTI